MSLALPANTSINHPPDAAPSSPHDVIFKGAQNIAECFIKNIFI